MGPGGLRMSNFCLYFVSVQRLFFLYPSETASPNLLLFPIALNAVFPYPSYELPGPNFLILVFNQAIYRFNFKYHKMRKTIVILVIVMAVATAFTSCASSRGGCAMSQGYVGYGHAMNR